MSFLFFLINLIVSSFYNFGFIVSPEKNCKKSGYDKILNVSSLNLYIVAFLTFRKKKAYKKVTISSLDIQAARFNEFPYVLHVLLF